MDPHLVFSLRHLSAAALSAVAIYLVAHPPLIAWKVEGPTRSQPSWRLFSLLRCFARSGRDVPDWWRRSWPP